jgi:hypothetical protein
VLTSKKVKVRSYEQFMPRIRLMSYSSSSSAWILCIDCTSNILLVLKNLQVGLIDAANELHKEMRKELRHMETNLVCEMWISFM